MKSDRCDVSGRESDAQREAEEKDRQQYDKRYADAIQKSYGSHRF